MAVERTLAAMSRVRRAVPYVVAGAVFLLFLMALFWRLWTPIHGARRTFGWDAQWEYWGDLQFQHDAYAHHELPLWNPYDRAGYPFHADPQPGIFYPPTWGLLALSAALGRTPFWLIAAKIVFHYWWACMGVFVYLRRRDRHLAACYLGGAAFVVGYPFLHNLFSALNWNIAWAPWVLAALDHVTDRPTRARAGLLALAAGGCALAGGPASLWYSLLLLIPYAAWAVTHGARAAGPRGSPARRDYLRATWVAGATCAGLVLAMVAVQFHSTAGVVGETVRQTRDLEFIRGSVLTMGDVVGFIAPRFPGENTYLGTAVVLWAVLATTAFVTPRRLVFAAVAVAGVALALGQNGDFLSVAASAIAPFGLFRRAHRYLYVVQLPMAILAAEGLDALIRLEPGERCRRITRAVWAVGGAAALVFAIGAVVSQLPGRGAQPVRDAFVLAAVGAIAATWLSLMVTRRSSSWRTGIGYLAAAVVAGNLWFAHSRQIDEAMYPVPHPAHDDAVTGLAGVPLGVRIYDREYLKFRPGIRLGIRDLGGYEGDPLALARYDRLLQRVRRAPSLLGRLNVGWLLEDPRKRLKGDRSGLETEHLQVSQVKDVAPAVLWADRAVAVNDAATAASELLGHPAGSEVVVEKNAMAPADLARALRPDLPARRSARITVPPAPPPDLTSGAGTGAAPPPAPTATAAGRLVALDRNRVVAEIDAPADGVVVLHEAYAPSWHATVDGAPAAVFPANAAFRGVLVGPGHHRIEMTYDPPGWRLLALVSLLGWLLAALIAVPWRPGMWRRLKPSRDAT